MADWSKPTLASYEIDVLDELKERDESSATMFDDDSDANKPVGSIQYQWNQGIFRRWNGNNWNNTTVSVAGGGTGADNASDARVNLGANNASNLNTGTIPIARVQQATTSQRGAVQLNDATNSTSLTTAATANAVKKLGDVVSDVEQFIIPSGGIIMWSGSLSNIPQGWQICNGSNGTPDLRNRFVVGAGASYGVGNTGGADSVTLNTNQIPSHNHSATSGAAGLHSHSYTLAKALGTVGTSRIGRGQESDVQAGRSGGIDSAGQHNHSITVFNTGGGQSHENRPPYYALAYIMKL